MLPLPELVEDVVSLAVEEALPSNLKEQSPTVMIEGVLGELAPKWRLLKPGG